MPFLLYRDGDDRQVIIELPEDRPRLTIGRSPRNDVALRWDGEVSRLHAELERVGADWLVSDDRLSRNGTYVNGERAARTPGAPRGRRDPDRRHAARVRRAGRRLDLGDA